jgi:hypothetical protein
MVPAMRMLTVFRVVAWAAVIVVGWSLAIRWGTDADVGNGPPIQFGKKVVGAAVLAGVVAVVLTMSGRKGAPPAWWARGVAVAASLGALGIAWYLRSWAHGDGFPDLVAGPGWMWMFAGAGLSFAAAIGTVGLPAKKIKPAQKSKPSSRGSRARR